MNLKLKFCLILLFALFVLLATGNQCYAQTDRNEITPDNATPDSLLEFRLSHARFLYYYGTDDSSRAIINMFFRKRSFFPKGTRSENNIYCGIGLIIITDGIILPLYLTRLAINCTIYNRQRLLYALLDHENGYPYPEDIVFKLKPVDFGVPF